MFKKIILQIEGTIAWSRSKLGDKQFIFLSAVLVGISAAFAVIVLKAFAHWVFTFATYGVGMFIGTNYSGFVVEQNKLADATGHNWTSIWLTPAAIAGAVLIAFILFFKEKKEIAAA